MVASIILSSSRITIIQRLLCSHDWFHHIVSDARIALLSGMKTSVSSSLMNSSFVRWYGLVSAALLVLDSSCMCTLLAKPSAMPRVHLAQREGIAPSLEVVFPVVKVVGTGRALLLRSWSRLDRDWLDQVEGCQLSFRTLGNEIPDEFRLVLVA